MKKLISLTLALMLVFSLMVTTAFAEPSKTTEITAYVPLCGYTLTIPENVQATFGEDELDVGTMSVTPVEGFCEGKNIKVTAAFTDFTCPTTDTKLPYSVVVDWIAANGSGHLTTKSNPSSDAMELYFDGTPEAEHGDYIGYSFKFIFDDGAWAKAITGNYKATITFTSELIYD